MFLRDEDKGDDNSGDDDEEDEDDENEMMIKYTLILITHFQAEI
jgi:hypothetical protein